jgi:toxin FitB
VIILDTNVVSELMKAAPRPGVVAWAVARPARDLVTTAITVAEVRYGLARLPRGRRRDALTAAADEVFAALPGAVLPFDADAAGAYAEVVVERDEAGRPISVLDAQIAAIARSRGAALATRNTADFDGLRLPLVDPWSPA